ncbi:MAG: nitrophenyl compound nitroreductase subunit ArsF family protein [Alloprevotella sp.]
MKKTFLLALMCLFALAVTVQAQVKERVEVVYFHGKQRCATCMAIEKYAREVVNQDFADEQKSGKVVFKVVDISTTEGKKLAKSYRVTWSSLFINSWKDGKEQRGNITEFSFKNARSHTEEFKKGVRDKIKEGLKQ